MTDFFNVRGLTQDALAGEWDSFAYHLGGSAEVGTEFAAISGGYKLISKIASSAKTLITTSRGAITASEEIAGATGAGTGTTGAKLIGSMDGLTVAEKRVVTDLVSQGKTVEIIPKDPNSIIKTPDFKVNGIKTELKTLENPNTNTGMKRIQEGFNQGGQTVIIDGRNAGLISTQAQEIINRAAGKYPNNQLPGKVEIWTNEGVITYP